MTAPHLSAVRHEVAETVEGTALLVDVRRSSQIIEFVQSHHGADDAAKLVMRFLGGVMEVVERYGAYECAPSGDAVLALFTGEKRKSDAIDAACAAMSFVRHDFSVLNQEYLTCRGQCGDQNCVGSLPFEVGAGIDDGQITVMRLVTPCHASRQLVGVPINSAAKLSGAEPPGSIMADVDMFLWDEQLRASYRWRLDKVTVRGLEREAVLIEPPG
jgi:class 3 adenylate cyclase